MKETLEELGCAARLQARDALTPDAEVGWFVRSDFEGAAAVGSQTRDDPGIAMDGCEELLAIREEPEREKHRKAGARIGRQTHGDLGLVQKLANLSLGPGATSAQISHEEESAKNRAGVARKTAERGRTRRSRRINARLGL